METETTNGRTTETVNWSFVYDTRRRLTSRDDEHLLLRSRRQPDLGQRVDRIYLRYPVLTEPKSLGNSKAARVGECRGSYVLWRGPRRRASRSRAVCRRSRPLRCRAGTWSRVISAPDDRPSDGALGSVVRAGASCWPRLSPRSNSPASATSDRRWAESSCATAEDRPSRRLHFEIDRCASRSKRRAGLMAAHATEGGARSRDVRPSPGPPRTPPPLRPPPRRSALAAPPVDAAANVAQPGGVFWGTLGSSWESESHETPRFLRGSMSRPRLDTVGVGGSNPLVPTKITRS